MKRVLLIALLLVVVMATWAAYSRVMQQRRETAYVTAIAPLKRDLRLGTTRRDVAAYLTSRHIAYNGVRYGGSDGWTYQVQIGEEAGNLACESWKVYAAMEFNASDHLTDVHLRKVGTCL